MAALPVGGGEVLSIELVEGVGLGSRLPYGIVEPAVDDRRRLVGWQAQRGGVG